MITSVIMAAGNNENLVNVFGTLSVVCFVLAAVFAVFAVIMFFIFDIRNIFDMRTGRAQKRVITEMEAENALTGRLINPNARAKGKGGRKKKPQGSGQHSSFSEKLQRMKEKDTPNFSSQNYQNYQQQYQQPYNGYEQAYAPKPLMDVPQPVQNPTPNYAPNSFTLPVDNNMNQTTVLSNDNENQTTVLGNNDSMQTSVLGNDDSMQTSVLDNNDSTQTTVLSHEVSIPAPSIANAPQPVHNVALNGELGKAAGSIDFKVGDGETSRLDKEAKAAAAPKVHFNIVKNVMLVHTQEIIQ